METYVGLPAVYTLHVIVWSSQLHRYEHILNLILTFLLKLVIVSAICFLQLWIALSTFNHMESCNMCNGQIAVSLS